MILPRHVCVCSSGVTDAHIKWIGYNCAISLSILHFSLCFLEFVVLSDPSPIIGFACHSLTDWLTHSLPFSKLGWSEPGMWRWQLKTCWSCFYRTRVRSLAMLVTHWLTHWLTHSLTHSCLVNLIDVTCGLWRYQLKTCWVCYCCWCWWWETFWRQFYAVLEAEVWS